MSQDTPPPPPTVTVTSPADNQASMASRNTGPGQNVAYDPLPNVPDHPLDIHYDQDPRFSQARSLSYHTPETTNADLPAEPPSPPSPAVSRPRFMGAALADEGGANPRLSWASSHNTGPSYSGSGAYDNDSSVFALNPDGTRDSGTPVPSTREPSQFYGYRDDPGSENDVAMTQLNTPATPNYLAEKHALYAAPRSGSRRRIIILSVLVGLIVVIIAVVVAVYFTVVRKSTSNDSTKSDGSSTANPTPTSGSGGTQSKLAVTGGDGSKVTMDDGSTFTYSNSFGGYWYWDENDPFNNGARAQSWSPALNETFNWGVDRIRGVNLGGWLNTEPFIAPALYEKYINASTPAVDEWTLSTNMAADTANGGLQQLEQHYKTFITEQDFAEIAGAGLNFVRIPLPYWAIETRGDEPFLAKTSWTYFLKAIKWARKYGLRINLDLHALPGSQNGWNHSGKLGDVNVLNGAMGYANAQRSLDYIRVLAEFISQEEYKDVVVMFGITNEPQESVMGLENLSRYYLQSYNIVREASGTGEGNGPFISYHDGFLPRDQWAGFLPGADRIALDSHPYICFGGQSDAAMSTYAKTPCTTWASSFNQSMTAFGMTAAGEFSNAVTDCGKWVNGVNLGARYDGTYTGTWPSQGSCDPWTDWPAWDDTMKQATLQFALASMDALQNWFFWTWKIGNSTVTGKVESPAWSYQLGLQNGWMPKDPRSADGTCGNTAPWSPPLQPSQTGGAGAGSIPASVSASLAWPPTSISNAGAVTALPSYTQTGSVPTLTAGTFSASGTATISAGNGWANSADTASMYVAISTCSYLDPWVGPSAAPPSPLCSGAAKRAPVPEPLITAPPS
ncbi:glycoside hydrolase family 5 protein [Neolentinus lepideus HHB14362 ss-1]|uniref:glucan 1,3-beta-glucosidase n=1 Tax=Neolentinus lepideus HHB14362 ss-1 TaxID=1314782 RepID=A0A165UNT0_9AGAM|nr:glycoside hydrolase family 5 protein [Neolentinus lepideus HHB14362 ss-1]